MKIDNKGLRQHLAQIIRVWSECQHECDHCREANDDLAILYTWVNSKTKDEATNTILSIAMARLEGTTTDA